MLKIELLTAGVGLSLLPLQLSCCSCMSADLGLADSSWLSEELGCCCSLGREILMVPQYCFSDSCGLKGLQDQGEKNGGFFLKSLSRILKSIGKRKKEKRVWGDLPTCFMENLWETEQTARSLFWLGSFLSWPPDCTIDSEQICCFLELP